jgi:hypothetical protein
MRYRRCRGCSKIEAIAQVRLDSAGLQCPQELHPLTDAVEVDDKAIRIIGSRVLQAAIAAKQTANENVRGDHK